MVKLDASVLRHFTRDHFRVLTAIEMGMKNHELVPTQLINTIAQLKHGGCHKSLGILHKHKLVWHERKKYDGYRLNYAGYDYLALRALARRNVITSIANQIGTGKESDVYMVSGTLTEGEGLLATTTSMLFALKLHRLGRTSFRTVKRNRDYLEHRRSASWLYLSRLAALKEFAYMKVLYDNGFPVPRPIDINRHAVLMELVPNCTPLVNIRELKNPAKVFSSLMDIVVAFADSGLIHGDFNEFNLLVKRDTEEIVVIDFPQMTSTDHPNAEDFFKRDIESLRIFFRKRFGFDAAEVPQFNKDVKRKKNLDRDVRASGFTREMEKEMEELAKQQIEEANRDPNEPQPEQQAEAACSSEESSEEESEEDSSDEGETTAPDTPGETHEEEAIEPHPFAPRKEQAAAAVAEPIAPKALFSDEVLHADDEKVAEETLKQIDEGKVALAANDSEEDAEGEEARPKRVKAPRPKKTADHSASSISDKVRQQLSKKRQKQKSVARNDYKNREKRKLKSQAVDTDY